MPSSPGYTTIGAYVPNDVAERVDQAAKEHKASRSQFVAVAIDRLLSNHADMTPKPNRSNRDGSEAAAMVLLKANPSLSCRQLAALLKQHGIKRGKTWVYDRRFEFQRHAAGRLIR